VNNPFTEEHIFFVCGIGKAKASRGTNSGRIEQFALTIFSSSQFQLSFLVVRNSNFY